MNFSFCIQTHAYSSQAFILPLQDSFINFVKIVCIIIRVHKFWWFMICGTYFLCYYNFIHCIVNDSVVLFLPVKYIPGYGAVPVVLSRNTLSVLTSKVPQDLTFLWIISRAVDETGFWFSCRDIYITFLYAYQCSHPSLGQVLDEEASHLCCLMLPAWLVSSLVVFFLKVLLHIRK